MSSALAEQEQSLTKLKLAAIRYAADEGSAVDELLVQLTQNLKAIGVRVCGAIQHNQNDGDRRCDGMELEDPATGRRVLICESVPAARADCRIDESALAEAIAWADVGLRGGADLLIVNKFGKREASGRGFTPIIGHAIELGVPVLVGVGDRNADAWNFVAEGRFVVLRPSHDIVTDWCLGNFALQTK